MTTPKTPEGQVPETPVPDQIWIAHNQERGEFHVHQNRPNNFVMPCYEWCVLYVSESLLAAEKEKSRKLAEALESYIEDHAPGCDCWQHQAFAEFRGNNDKV